MFPKDDNFFIYNNSVKLIMMFDLVRITTS